MMESEMPAVAVLMSTYNGEKFIREQIDSIIAQKDVEVRLLIRDDGSRDHTSEIIIEYTEKYPNIFSYMGENIGLGKSFLELLKNAPEADYYAFADQDDVWLEDKLSRAVNIIHKLQRSDLAQNACGKGVAVLADGLQNIHEDNNKEVVPLLYVANQTLVDAELNVLSIRFSDIPVCDLFKSMTTTAICGCTMVMNRQLKKICCCLPLPSERVLKRKNHDAWLLYCAYLLGVVVYDHESRMLYRQHANNVVGAFPATGLMVKWKRFITRRNKEIRSSTARDLIEALQELMSDDMKRQPVWSGLEDVANCQSFSGAVKLIRNPWVRPAFFESTMVLFIKAVVGWI